MYLRICLFIQKQAENCNIKQTFCLNDKNYNKRHAYFIAKYKRQMMGMQGVQGEEGSEI